MKDNVFQYEKDVRILAFTTEKGHVSGELMKNIKFRLPREIEKLHTWIEEGQEIGQILITNHVVFVVLKRHYNSRLKREEFEAILKKIAPRLEPLKLKTTTESLEEYKDLVLDYVPHLKYYSTSKWEI